MRWEVESAMEYRASRAQKANGLGDIAAVHEKLQSCGHLQINRGTILREICGLAY
jgi:hypothetical protein